MPQQSTSSVAKSSQQASLRPEGQRAHSYGQSYQPTPVDRFGVWLSSRQIKRFAGDLREKVVADFGCGFHAAFIRSVLSEINRATVVDCTLADELKSNPKIRAIEGVLPDAIGRIDDASVDVVLCISVLEHLWRPQEALQEFRRIVRPGGVCLFNVPSWRGKRFLEYSAFRLGFSPKDEMDDHKAYYDVKDFWPLLVAAGFRPSNIQCFSHKFGLNTFASCRVPQNT